MAELPVITSRHSVFDSRALEDIYQEIRDIYLADKRPWVIGYSGGKDSTCTLQLIWVALAGLHREQLQKPVYVISSDTLVETPVIVRYIDTTLNRINEASGINRLPFEAHKVQPVVDDSFWVNMIGRGYPAPNSNFRWCTERLKIAPANRFITDRVAEFGEVVLVLGVRSAESATRAQVMSLHKIGGSRLARHSSLLNAFVYTPIEAFTVDDVWTYLLQVDCPWGNDNRDLVAMYRNAQAGECPLVVDTTTPSCGNSRFGCWVCTVVTKDRTMQSMVDSGEEWLEPLLEFRDLLAETQDPEKKRNYREFRRKSGHVSFIRGTSTPVPGPYTLVFCRELLEKLLESQKRVQEAAPPGEAPVLVHDAEIHEIRRIWRTERGDWEDSVPSIVRKVLGHDLEWAQDDQVLLSAGDATLLHSVCASHDVPPELLMRLIDVERSVHDHKKRHQVHKRLEAVLQQEWRPENEVVAEHEAKMREGTK